MKANVIFLFLFAMFLAGCSEKEESPLEGTWQMVYLQSISADTLVYEFPGNMTGSQIKMWSDEHFVFVGRYTMDTLTQDSYGGGTYTLEGNMYEENIIYHAGEDYVGQTIKMLVEISNDSLTQTYPVDDEGKVDESNCSVEKYVRLD
jgi:hypothetical protein